MAQTQVLSLDFLTGNDTRNYPIRDGLQRTDDAGNKLPDNLLSDINIWVPEAVGVYLFISSVTISDKLVSVTIGAQDFDPNIVTSEIDYIPVAAITVTKPIDVTRNYVLQPMIAGVGGWMSFGMSVNNALNNTYRFSDPKQTGLLPRLCRSYPVPGVTGFKKLGFANKLTGMTRLVSGDPDTLVIEKGREVLDGILRDCVVFRLNEEVAGRDIYSRYVGPCGGVPESQSCRSKPIYKINQMTPDCDGIIYLHLKELPILGGAPDMVVSYADTNNNNTEPTQGAKPTAHTLNLDYNRGISNICREIPTQIVNNQASPCDDPCARDFENLHPYTTEDGAASGNRGIPNIIYSWSSGVQKEPSFDNGERYLTKGPQLRVDITNYATITITGDSNDICWWNPPNVTVNEVIDARTNSVTVTVDDASIFFEDTHGFIKSVGQRKINHSTKNSVQKTITTGDGHKQYTFTAGNTANTGTGHVSRLASAGFDVKAFGVTLTKASLVSKGYAIIDGDKTYLVGQFCHLVSGIGWANIVITAPPFNVMTEDDCIDSSSSSSSSGG